MTKKTQEVAVVEKKKAVKRSPNPNDITMEAVLYEAVQQGMSADALEKLVGLKERLDAKEAEKTFNIAFAKFQGSISVIIGRKEGSKTSDGTVAFKYAPIEQIIEVIRAPMAECGLSVSFDGKLTDKIRKTVCTVTHIDGHSKSASFESERSEGTRLMSNLQKESSTVSHHRRYALNMVLNIVTEGEDDENAIFAMNGDKEQASKKNGLISARELKKLENEIGSSDEVLYNKVTQGFKVVSLAELKKTDLKDCLQRVKEYKQLKSTQQKDRSKS